MPSAGVGKRRGLERFGVQALRRRQDADNREPIVDFVLRIRLDDDVDPAEGNGQPTFQIALCKNGRHENTEDTKKPETPPRPHAHGQTHFATVLPLSTTASAGSGPGL